MAALISPDLLKRLEQLQLLARRRSKSTSKGERRSGARGQSVEFADYRNYVPGDDLRRIDWNIYGRLDRLFLKLYEEEREFPVTIFVPAVKGSPLDLTVGSIHGCGDKQYKGGDGGSRKFHLVGICAGLG